MPTSLRADSRGFLRQFLNLFSVAAMLVGTASCAVTPTAPLAATQAATSLDEVEATDAPLATAIPAATAAATATGSSVTDLEEPPTGWHVGLYLEYGC